MPAQNNLQPESRLSPSGLSKLRPTNWKAFAAGKKVVSARGKLHGPYWYSYTRVDDKVTSQYIGKNLPKDIERRLNKINEK